MGIELVDGKTNDWFCEIDSWIEHVHTTDNVVDSVAQHGL
jgi:hypothetical protein